MLGMHPPPSHFPLIKIVVGCVKVKLATRLNDNEHTHAARMWKSCHVGKLRNLEKVYIHLLLIDFQVRNFNFLYDIRIRRLHLPHVTRLNISSNF